MNMNVAQEAEVKYFEVPSQYLCEDVWPLYKAGKPPHIKTACKMSIMSAI